MHDHTFAYVVIECHYTGRLLDADTGEPVQGMKQAARMTDSKIVFVDHGHGDCVETYEVGDMGPVLGALGRGRGDVVVIQTARLGGAMAFVDEIMKIGHCGFFVWGSLIYQSFGVTATGEGVMHMLFDTSSG